MCSLSTTGVSADTSALVHLLDQWHVPYAVHLRIDAPGRGVNNTRLTKERNDKNKCGEIAVPSRQQHVSSGLPFSFVPQLKAFLMDLRPSGRCSNEHYSSTRRIYIGM